MQHHENFATRKEQKRLGEIQLLGTEFAVLTWLIMMFPIHLSSLQSFTNTSSSFYDRQQIFKWHHKIKFMWMDRCSRCQKLYPANLTVFVD